MNTNFNLKKTFYVDAYFNDFKEKIERCEKLYQLGYESEAALLLCCYIDALAARSANEDAKKKHFMALLERNDQDCQRIIERRKISEWIYKSFRCGWVHHASTMKPSRGCQFTEQVEYLGNGKEEKYLRLNFPWQRMVKITYRILDEAYRETLAGT